MGRIHELAVKIDSLKKVFDLMGMDHNNAEVLEDAMSRIDLLGNLLQKEKDRFERLMRKAMRRK